MTQNTPKLAVDPNTTFDAFYGTSAPRGRKGRAWTFKHFCEVCDTPGANRVQALLVASDTTGFALYARQNRWLHRVTQDDYPVIFRTIEQALDALVGVPHLASEISINAKNWSRPYKQAPCDQTIRT